MSERVEYGVLDRYGHPAMWLGVPYTTLREAEQRWAWLESLPDDFEDFPPFLGPFRVVQRTRVVQVTEWEPVGDGSTNQ